MFPFILTGYIDAAMAHAEYEKLDDGSYCGRVPVCAGVLAFAPTLARCEAELRSTLEDWILLGLKLKHSLPVIDGLDLNQEPRHEPVDAV